MVAVSLCLCARALPEALSAYFTEELCSHSEGCSHITQT